MFEHNTEITEVSLAHCRKVLLVCRVFWRCLKICEISSVLTFTDYLRSNPERALLSPVNTWVLLFYLGQNREDTKGMIELKIWYSKTRFGYMQQVSNYQSMNTITDQTTFLFSAVCWPWSILFHMALWLKYIATFENLIQQGIARWASTKIHQWTKTTKTKINPKIPVWTAFMSCCWPMFENIATKQS